MRPHLILVCLASLACTGTRLALLPPAPTPLSTKDPDPIRPPVSQGREEGGPTGDPGPRASDVDVGVTIAALALWAIAGVYPLLGLFGSFDEDRAVRGRTDRQPARRVERTWRDLPGCPAFLCGAPPP